ncbi:hypothetical protein C0J50_14427 [Silurus asotus]|uniref:Uncharacterized protein n=1 Tax=Silurus asotus TaxID=30991 RepID=A0AAD5FS04_SILAS|nr:hypothetical protein C0J50_14427 [Silurus asotus]
MNPSRMRGLDCRVNLMVQYARQLTRSLLLLAHYMAVFVSFTSRSAGWFVEAIRWTTFSVRCVASLFDSVHRSLSRLSRRCTGIAVEIRSGKESDSE